MIDANELQGGMIVAAEPQVAEQVKPEAVEKPQPEADDMENSDIGGMEYREDIGGLQSAKALAFDAHRCNFVCAREVCREDVTLYC